MRRNFLVSIVSGLAFIVAGCGSKSETATSQQLAFKSQPASATSGQNLATVTVSIEDAAGDTTDTNATITLTLASDSNAILCTPQSFPATHGTATFNALCVHGSGTQMSLIATSPGLTSTTSSTFTITALSAGDSCTNDNDCGYNEGAAHCSDDVCVPISPPAP